MAAKGGTHTAYVAAIQATRPEYSMIVRVPESDMVVRSARIRQGVWWVGGRRLCRIPQAALPGFHTPCGGDSGCGHTRGLPSCCFQEW
jgi:hypothetical protein